MQQKPARLIQRFNTAAVWVSNNPILLEGELGIESDTGKVKLGDGSTPWNSLDYCINMIVGPQYAAGEGTNITYDGVLSTNLRFEYIDIGGTGA